MGLQLVDTVTIIVMDPRDKGVFLTGGAQGLGRGIVVKLLSLGAKVRK